MPAKSPGQQANNTSVNGVRACRFVPGVSTPASMPPGLVNQPKAKPRPIRTAAPTSSSNENTELQLRVLSGLSEAVSEHYVYPDFRGHDWKAMTARYRSKIQAGMNDSDFYEAMQALVSELGDEHSYFQSPAQVKAEESALASQYNFVGIGALFTPIAATDYAAVMSLFADSPAAQAGLQVHDILLKVDGGSVRDESGKSRTLGPEGSNVKLTLQRPGKPPYDLILTRRQVTGQLPIDYCLVPRTRVGYIFLPTLLDKTMAAQVSEALRKMTAEGPLQGLILDNRMNGGGLGSQAKAIMSLVAGGVPGYFVSRTSREPLQLNPEDIGGSQKLPQVVLVDTTTVSFGEIMSGVLRHSGRARIVGARTPSHVEQLRPYKYPDGSRAWLASDTFEPQGMTKNIWEYTGIVPDVPLPTRWDLFTEANDPGLAKGVELLMKK